MRLPRRNRRKITRRKPFFVPPNGYQCQSPGGGVLNFVFDRPVVVNSRPNLDVNTNTVDVYSLSDDGLTLSVTYIDGSFPTAYVFPPLEPQVQSVDAGPIASAWTPILA